MDDRLCCFVHAPLKIIYPLQSITLSSSRDLYSIFWVGRSKWRESLALSRRIFITGFGLVTPLGHSAWETFAALLAGRTIADRVRELPCDISTIDMVRAIGGVSFAQHSPCDPSVELAERAAREALAMAAVSGSEIHDVPCIIATSKGAVHALTQAADRHVSMVSGLKVTQPITHQRVLDAHLSVVLGSHGYLTHHLERRLHLGEVTHLVAACASSLIALHRARLSLLYDDACAANQPTNSPRRMLIVSADAALLPAFIHAYHRLGVLAPLSPQDYRGLPLDEAASGFMIAQAGAAIVLESVDDDQWQPPRHAVELIDSSEACDAFDLIRPCESMPALHHLSSRLLRDRHVDLIHPHATGTEHHDRFELDAIRATMGPSTPDFYAHKGALGHTLGCSGLISIIIACLCARTQRRPPMPWLKTPISPLITSDSPRGSIRTQAVFAAGFAGHAAAAILASPQCVR